jgi:hypothetical protein
VGQEPARGSCGRHRCPFLRRARRRAGTRSRRRPRCAVSGSPSHCSPSSVPPNMAVVASASSPRSSTPGDETTATSPAAKSSRLRPMTPRRWFPWPWPPPPLSRSRGAGPGSPREACPTTPSPAKDGTSSWSSIRPSGTTARDPARAQRKHGAAAAREPNWKWDAELMTVQRGLDSSRPPWARLLEDPLATGLKGSLQSRPLPGCAAT